MADGSRSFFIKAKDVITTSLLFFKIMCLPTSRFCQTPCYLTIFRFEGKITELDFANKFYNMTS